MTENVLNITISGETDDVEVSAFLAIVKNTVSLLRQIEAGETGGSNRLRWVVTSVTKPSAVRIRMAGVDEHRSSEPIHVVESFLSGMRLLEEGGQRPAGFTDTMLDMATSIVRPLNNSVSRVVFADEKATAVVPVSQHLAANATRLRLPDEYTEYGELEGVLDAPTGHKPSDQLSIIDLLTDRAIICQFNSDDFPLLRELLNERIRVSGLVTFRRRDDEPLSVLVEEWHHIPRDESLPTIKDLHAAGIHLTGSRRSEDVIAELRRAGP